MLIDFKYLRDILLVVSAEKIMENNVNEITVQKQREAIDDYFECTSFCEIDESVGDCQTICMEKFLKGKYF